MVKPFLAIAALALASACTVIPGGGQVAARPAGLGYQVGIDRAVQVGKVVVTPKRLVEDSRCPMNARCVWAGRVILRAQIDGEGWRDTANLTLGEPYGTHNMTVTLVSATPERTTDTEPDQSRYRFAFEGG